MIKVTRLNHTSVILNSDLIEQIEITPDTVITLTSGQKFMVLESAQEILEEVVEFRKSLLNRDLMRPLAASLETAEPQGRPLAEEASSHGR
ncbi:MAG TPA: flagellar FlbD family protein [Bryobacteraceae bacterium]|jgi:flagellar protein FlbD